MEEETIIESVFFVGAYVPSNDLYRITLLNRYFDANSIDVLFTTNLVIPGGVSKIVQANRTIQPQFIPMVAYHCVTDKNNFIDLFPDCLNYLNEKDLEKIPVIVNESIENEIKQLHT